MDEDQQLYVIECLGVNRGPCDVEGHFLAAFDATTGKSTWTRDRYQAIHFSSAIEALKMYRTVHATDPIRPDGKPNRPLTAFTVSISML